MIIFLSCYLSNKSRRWQFPTSSNTLCFGIHNAILCFLITTHSWPFLLTFLALLTSNCWSQRLSIISPQMFSHCGFQWHLYTDESQISNPNLSNGLWVYITDHLLDIFTVMSKKFLKLLGTETAAHFPLTQALWPPAAKSWLIGKDPDTGKDWGQGEKGTTEDEMVGWHHRLNGHRFGWTMGVGDGQGGLACCGLWGCKESDTWATELNWLCLNSAYILGKYAKLTGISENQPNCHEKQGTGLGWVPVVLNSQGDY